MAGIFTDKRDIDTFQCKVTVWPPAHPKVPNVVISPKLISNQVTTSYRTSSLGPDRALTNAEIFSNAEEEGRHILAPWDTGHEFDSTKKTFYASNRRDVTLTGVDDYGSPVKVTGPLVPQAGVGTWMDVPDADISFGTKAINLTIPTKPMANVSQFLAESFVDFPELPLKALTIEKRSLTFLQEWQKFRKDLHTTGDQSLNLLFGWAPFASDLQKIAGALLEANKRLQQYVRDGQPGKVVRRSHTFASTIDTQTVYDQTFREGTGGALDGWGSVGDDPEYGWSSLCYPDKGRYAQRLTCVEQKIQQYKFSGAYSYIVPDAQKDAINNLRSFEQQANYLLGTRLTPDLVWQLTPWSWFVDWFVNIGTIIQNASLLTQDGLVLRYGYLSCHSQYAREYVVTGINLNGFPQHSVVSRYVTTRKQRLRSTPFGFGLDLNSFTDQQWAILASLGLTKGNSKHLRGGL